MDDEKDLPQAQPGIPQPDPPEGGPNDDDERVKPEDLTPGLGGSSETKPDSTEPDGAGG